MAQSMTILQLVTGLNQNEDIYITHNTVNYRKEKDEVPDLRCGPQPPTRLGRVSVRHLPQWCGRKLYWVQPMQAMGPQEV